MYNIFREIFVNQVRAVQGLSHVWDEKYNCPLHYSNESKGASKSFGSLRKSDAVDLVF